ncbi:hypothetical protein [Agrobacterium leguminum]
MQRRPFFLPGIARPVTLRSKPLRAEREYRTAQPRLAPAARKRSQPLENNRRQRGGQQSDAENQKAVKTRRSRSPRLKAAISTINAKVQDFNIQVGNFTSALKEASEVNPDDAKIRQVTRLSTEIDGLTKDVPHHFLHRAAA